MCRIKLVCFQIVFRDRYAREKLQIFFTFLNETKLKSFDRIITENYRLHMICDIKELIIKQLIIFYINSLKSYKVKDYFP